MRAATDAEFDRIYPDWAREKSRQHWTPLAVVHRAVELLASGRREARILDVGAGAGKFCIAGALASRAWFTGIEQRPHLCALSRELAGRHGADRARFLCGDLSDVDWRDFDAIYLFNPFEEHRSPFCRIDDSIQPSRETYARYVGAVEERLERMPIGTRLVTYHGFGGRVPGGFTRFPARPLPPEATGPLELWVKWRRG